MSVTKQIGWGVLFGVVLSCAAAFGQDQDPGTGLERIEKDQQALRSELELIRSELQAIRALLDELKQQADEAAAERERQKHFTPGLRQMDTKLNSIIADLGKLKRTMAAAEQAKKRVDDTIYEIEIGTSPVRGARNAPVTIVEFADFQCPFSIREWPKIKTILGKYPGQVRFVLKHYPLSRHKEARPAHAATILAGQQLGDEGCWKMHDLIIANPKELGIADLRAHAETLGLDLERFDELMADPAAIDALLAPDHAAAKKCNVRGTPTVLINGLKLAKRGLADYEARIAALLKEGGRAEKQE